MRGPGWPGRSGAKIVIVDRMRPSRVASRRCSTHSAATSAGCVDLPAIAHPQAVPVQPADAARRVAPGHPGAEGQLLRRCAGSCRWRRSPDAPRAAARGTTSGRRGLGVELGEERPRPRPGRRRAVGCWDTGFAAGGRPTGQRLVGLERCGCGGFLDAASTVTRPPCMRSPASRQGGRVLATGLIAAALPSARPRLPTACAVVLPTRHVA